MIPTYPTPPTSTLEHLTRIRTALSDPSHWTKGVMARDPLGHQILSVFVQDPRSEVACCCLAGAALRTCGRLHRTGPIGSDFTEVNYRLSQATSPLDYMDFNDRPSTTHADILAALDLAIEQETPAHAR